MKARYLPARPIFLTHFDFTIPYPFLACSGLFTYRPKVSKKMGIYYLLTPLRPPLPTTYLPTYLPTQRALQQFKLRIRFSSRYLSSSFRSPLAELSSLRNLQFRKIRGMGSPIS